jgi:hypothetical protein
MIVTDRQTTPHKHQYEYFEEFGVVTCSWCYSTLDPCNFIQLDHRKGLCALYSMSLAFNTPLDEMQQLFEVVVQTPKSGCTLDEIKEAIKYSEAIYKRSTCKVKWRGKLFDFIQQYPEGTWLVNCNDHLGLVFNGVIFGSKLKNYNVYGAWQMCY